MAGRVDLASEEQAKAIARAIGAPEVMATRNAFRTLANSPTMAEGVFTHLTTLLNKNTFETRLRELAIMRIGWVTGSEYEWTQHWRVATTAGVPEEDILAVRDWQNADRLIDADRAILQAVDEMLDGGKISDPTWAECCKHVPTDGERVEMVVCIANWIMFSNLLRTLEIPVEDGVMSWPPDGRVPESAAAIRN
ncbi:MAG: carboxymuconolactone decarboxylase family protein [Alphaproteobacteria bacterium]|jgi:alkylhydroperoxidase family enzyme